MGKQEFLTASQIAKGVCASHRAEQVSDKCTTSSSFSGQHRDTYIALPAIQSDDG